MDALLRKAEQMIKEGAAVLDIGGQSTRPNSQRVNADEERQRVLPAIEQLQKRFPSQLLSIDRNGFLASTINENSRINISTCRLHTTCFFVQGRLFSFERFDLNS